MKKLRILLLVALALLIASSIWAARSHWYLTKGVETRGMVVDLIPTGRSIHLVIRFTTAEDTVVEKKLGSGGPGFAIGDSIPVYYDPQNPEHFRVNWFVNLWLGPLMLAIGGVINIILWVILSSLIRRQYKKSLKGKTK